MKVALQLISLLMLTHDQEALDVQGPHAEVEAVLGPGLRRAVHRVDLQRAHAGAWSVNIM